MLRILDIKWPSALGGLFRFFSWVMNTSPQIFLPFAILAAFCLAWVVAYCVLWQRSPTPGAVVRREWLTRRLQLTCYSVFGYFYPSIVQACLTVFFCYPVDNPVPAGTSYPEHLQDTASAGYWIPDMTNPCFHGWHLRWTGFLAVPGLLLLGVGIPIVFAALLFRMRHALATDMCKQKLGYAYKSYRINRWWEQSSFQLRQLAMLLVVVNGRPVGNYLQILMLLCLFQSEVLYHVFLRPYRFPHIQFIHILLASILGSSLLAALFLENFEGKASAGGLAAIAIGKSVVNILFCLYILCLICTKFLPQARSFCLSAWNKLITITKPLHQPFKAFIGTP